MHAGFLPGRHAVTGDQAMSKSYHYLPLSKVAAGMVLADDLLDKQGHVLLPAGTALSASMLTSIAHHNIHQLSVEADALSETEQESERVMKLARLDRLFRNTPPDDATTNALLAYVTKYRQDEAK